MILRCVWNGIKLELRRSHAANCQKNAEDFAFAYLGD